MSLIERPAQYFLASGRQYRLVAAVLFLVTFLIYNATKSPTVSFWDCGEFIACSYVLGVPHPPGAPLYILLGRIFSILPTSADIGARVNLLSAVSGAVAGMLAFLILFRLIRNWYRAELFSGWRLWSAYIAATVGSLMACFGEAMWNNCLEAEVYAPAMMLMMLMFWLLVLWKDNGGGPQNDKYLILITYLGFLSTGIHMTTFLLLPAIFLGVIMLSEELRRNVAFLITSGSLYLIAINLDSFLIASAIMLVVLTTGVLLRRLKAWRLPLYLTLAAIAGFSCQMYIPIRAAQSPVINMNEPTSYSTFRSFLERKQYGAELMLTRALTRRGELGNQFGNHERMGFWGFFSNQYGLNGRGFALLFVLGLLGLYELARRQMQIGAPFALAVFLGTVFLVWYMNFADGTRVDQLTGEGHIEVRDRDYFFTPGFMFFGMAIGLGVAALIEALRDSPIWKISFLRVPISLVTALLILLGVVPIKANYFECDRSRNYVAYDFAYNILESCDLNAILFVGGDNDTFPVWCLQEVYRFRRDVTTVNLSLANTFWYLIQVRDRMKLPLPWNDDQIYALRHKVTSSGQVYQIHEQAVDEILAGNAWKRPINFCISAGTDALRYRGRSLADNIMVHGMVYQLYPDKPVGHIDLEKNWELYLKRLQFRSLADTTIYKDRQSLGLAGNYTIGFQLMADSLARANKFDEAIDLIRRAVELFPFDRDTRYYLAQLYVEAGREELLSEMMARSRRDEVRDIYLIWGLTAKKSGDRTKAEAILRMTLDSFPDFEDAFYEYARFLHENNAGDSLRQVVSRWLDRHPGDAEARRILEGLKPTPSGGGL